MYNAYPCFSTHFQVQCTSIFFPWNLGKKVHIRHGRIWYFFAAFTRGWHLIGQDCSLPDLFTVTCRLLLAKPGTTNTAGQSLWGGEWMPCPSLSPLFSGSSLGPVFGMGPCSLQVSPKSSCPCVSFSSWKRKFILKAALLFVLLVIPSWMGVICRMLGWSSHSMFLWCITFPFRPSVTWCSGKNRTPSTATGVLNCSFPTFWWCHSGKLSDFTEPQFPLSIKWVQGEQGWDWTQRFLDFLIIRDWKRTVI